MPSENVKNYGTVTITAAAATTLRQDSHSGVLLISDLAATQTWTLPAATGSGNVYEILIKTTKTGDMVIQVDSSSDTMTGGVIVATDASGETHSTASTSDTITLNGTTKGGIAGSKLRLRDAYSGKWTVEGYLIASGTEATPFSAAV